MIKLKRGKSRSWAPRLRLPSPLQSRRSREPGISNAPLSPPSAARVARPVQAVALRTLEPPGCGVLVVSSWSVARISNPVPWAVGLRCAARSFAPVPWFVGLRSVAESSASAPWSLCGLLLASGLECTSISGPPLGPDTPPLPPSPKGCVVLLFNAADESR